MAPLKSHTTGKAIVVTFPDTEEQLLVVDIEIDCPHCGQQTIRLAGHHLRAIRNLLVEFIDMHPSLTGDDAGLEVVKRFTFKGRSTPTPEEN